MNRIIKLTFFIMLFLLITFNFISAQPVIDNEVLNEFNNKERVTITATLIDLGNRDLNINLQSEIISNFSEEEFKLNWKSSNGRGFEGNITKEGLEKLKKNPNILRVYLPVSGTTIKVICGDEICSFGEDCENCIFDCGCSETEECVGRECQLKEVSIEKNFVGFWVVIPISIILIIIMYIITKKIKYIKKKK